ncbi:dihydroorotase [Thermodesulfobacteriota bacterium]
MDLLLKGGHVIDPDHLDARMDILIKNGRIEAVIPSGKNTGRFPDVSKAPDSLKIIDLAGKVVAPGFIDMHVHFREPGHEHKETIQTGSLAAVYGGFTGVCTMPNTDPANDSPSITTYILEKARGAGMTKVYPCGAISHALKGNRMTRFDNLKKAGAVALSDDGMPVTSSRLMRKALENAKNYDLPVISHAEDLDLAGKGAMNEGKIAEDLKIPGIPNAAESIMVQRDIALAGITGGRVHIAHVSTRESVAAIRAAKQAGIPVTAETAPHYFMLTHEAVRTCGTNAKMNPPLRSAKDRVAIIEGLVDGTIDAIATDHAPHHPDEKSVAFEKAPNGIIGLETSVSLGLTLVAQGCLTLVDLIRKMSVNPSKILNIPCGLNVNASADITVIDLDIQTRVHAESFQSKSRNTPFDGWMLKGGPVLTIVDGRIVYQTF